MDLLLKGEIEYQKQILDVNFLKKREEAERKIVLERRGSSGGTFKLFGDSAYPNQIALNGISIGKFPLPKCCYNDIMLISSYGEPIAGQ